MVIDTDYRARYYAVTVERPAWLTVRRAIELFAAVGMPAARGDPSRPSSFELEHWSESEEDSRTALG